MRKALGDMEEKKRICRRLSSGNVAYGNWNPNNSKVKFNWNNADNRNPNMGARLEISAQQPRYAGFCVTPEFAWGTIICYTPFL